MVDDLNDTTPVPPKRYSHGARRPGAKLTDGTVVEIRRLYAAGKFTQCQLAKKFGIALVTVCRVVNRKAWRHV